MIQSIRSIHLLEELSSGDSVVHRLHPLVKCAVTLVYLIAVVSVDRYDVVRLIPFALYPVLIASIAEIPSWPVIKKILIIEPFIVLMGIGNPIFDPNTALIASLTVSAGWLSFASLCIKSALTVSAVVLLIATTGFDSIAFAMRRAAVPRVIVVQMLLTYRYISVLAEEVSRTVSAYSLRSSGRTALARSAWGSLPGQILLRSISRSERIYAAMCARGFRGEYLYVTGRRAGIADILFFAAASSLVFIFRYLPVTEYAGALLERMFS